LEENSALSKHATGLKNVARYGSTIVARILDFSKYEKNE